MEQKMESQISVLRDERDNLKLEIKREAERFEAQLAENEAKFNVVCTPPPPSPFTL